MGNTPTEILNSDEGKNLSDEQKKKITDFWQGLSDNENKIRVLRDMHEWNEIFGTNYVNIDDWIYDRQNSWKKYKNFSDANQIYADAKKTRTEMLVKTNKLLL